MCKISILPSRIPPGVMIDRGREGQKHTTLPGINNNVVKLPNTAAQCSNTAEQEDDKQNVAEKIQLRNTQEAIVNVNDEELKLAAIEMEAAAGPSNSKDPETEHLQRAKSMIVSSARRRHYSNGQSYKAINVKAINRSSETTAQHVNISEDKRLARKLTSIDRERNVFRNSITREEKMILQRSRALSEVILRRSARKERKVLSPPSPPQKLDKPDITYLYGEECEDIPSRPLTVRRSKTVLLKDTRSNRLKENKAGRGRDDTPKLNRSKTTMKLRDSKDTVGTTVRQKWARSITEIMNTEIKQWHKEYLDSEEQRTGTRSGPRLLKSSSTSRTPLMPTIPIMEIPTPPTPTPDKTLLDPLYSPIIISKHFQSSDSDIDKGAWITNYINTSCAEHLPML